MRYIKDLDKKFRETRKTEEQKAMSEELNQGINDDEIIFDLQMKAIYPNYNHERN